MIRKNVKLSNLLINTENPRFEMVPNQNEAIIKMIEDQKDKLSKLADDVVNYGLNPSDLIIVIENEKEAGFYNVLEGNRRIVVLKLLNNPNLIPDKFKSIYKKFKDLNNRYIEHPINEVQCVVFYNLDEANHWIKLKHTGENEGIGTVSWDAQQKSRFEERTGGHSSYALQAIEFLRNNNETNPDIKKKLNEVPSSSLQRLLSDPDIREVIGVSINDNKITSSYEPSEILKPLEKIAKDLLKEDFKVKEIYYKDDRLNYIETFKNNELPNKDKKLRTHWEITNKDYPQKQSTQKTKSKVLSTKRKTLIPKSCIIHINQVRINHIYRELKDLDIETYTNAVAVLFRVFIELTLDEFIENNKINNITKNDKLIKKVQTVSEYLKNNQHLDKHELKPIQVSVSDPNNILSIDSFNSYVHNKYFQPIPRDLKVSWDNIEIFVKKIWDLI